MANGAPRRRGITGRQALARLLVVVAIWLVVGFIRAPMAARAWFVNAHGVDTIVNVSIDALGPAIPPFWFVNVGGDIIEPGATSPSYRSHMILIVEPIAGFVLVFGQG
jgi:hypothetical protein